MSDYSPPTFDSPNFNTSLFLTDGGGYLTLLDADSRYLRLAGGTITGALTCTTGAIFNGGITSTGLTVSGNTSYTATNGSITFSGTNANILISGTNGYMELSGNHGELNLSGSGSHIHLTGVNSLISLSNTAASTTSTTGAIQCAGGAYFGANSIFNANLNVVGTLTAGSFTLSTLSLTTLSVSTSITMGSVVITPTELGYIDGLTAGTVSASKAVVVDSNKDISAFRNVFATKFCNNVSYSSFAIDMGNTAGDRLMAVFENGSAFYGLGANGSRLQLHSASGAGIRMYTGSSVGATGTQIFDIDSSGLITCDSITLGTALTVPLANIRDNAQASGTRTEFLSLGRSSSGTDQGAWAFMNYYQTATQGDSNYFTFGPRLKTGLTTGWGMVMTQNGNVSFQDKNANGGAGGFKIQANIVGTVDIQGGITRTIGAGHGYLQANSGSPAAYNASSVSTRIGLWVENAIWCGDKVYASSDIRLKRDIKTIPLDEAKKLLNINAVSYRWQKDIDDRFLPDIGFIAQDLLENKLDKIVSFCPSSDKEKFPLGYSYGLEYQKVCVYQNELIKDLYVQIEELNTSIIKKQQIHIENLQSDIEALKKAIETILTYNPLKKHIDKST